RHEDSPTRGALADGCAKTHCGGCAASLAGRRTRAVRGDRPCRCCGLRCSHGAAAPRRAEAGSDALAHVESLGRYWYAPDRPIVRTVLALTGATHLTPQPARYTGENSHR